MKAADYALYNTKTRQKELLDDDAINNAILGGTHSFSADASVPVIDPDGRRATIGAGELRAALKEGFKVIGPRELAIDEYLKDNDNMSGAAKVFFGQALDEFALGVPEMIADYTEDPFESAKREAIKKQFELANVLGGTTGFIGSALLGPARLASIGGKGITEAGKRALAARLGKAGGGAAAEAAAGGFLKKLGGATVDGIAEGALLSMPHAITESAFGDHEAAAESMLYGTMAGGIFGAGTGLTKELIDASRKGAGRFYSWAEGKPLTGPEVGKKIARSVTGQSEENIVHLADEANLERMITRRPEGGYDVKIPEKENIKDSAEAALSAVQQNNELAQKSYTQIQDDINVAFRRELDDIAKGSAPEPVISQVQDYLKRMKEAGGDIRIQFDDALKSIQSTVMDAADPQSIRRVPFYIPKQTITKAINTLEKQLGTESALLGKQAGMTASPGKMQAMRRLSEVKNMTDSYFQQVGELYGKDIPGMDLLFARNIVRDLDDIATYGLGAGEFDSAVSQTVKAAQKELRDSIRQKLGELQRKDLRTYLDPLAEQNVKQLAKNAETLWDKQINNAQVLSEAGQYFQNPIRTANALDSMTGKNFRSSQIAKALEAVEKEVGEPILPMLDEWMKRRGLLAESKLGGSQKEKVLATLFPDQYEVLEKARARAAAAEAEAAEFRGWNGRRIESTINRTDYKNASIEDARRLERLGELRDKYLRDPADPNYTPRNFAQEAKDRAVWDSFDQARVTGSRKALMGGSIGAAAGSVFGPTGAIVGQAIGSAAGGTLDYYGGKMLRDFIINGNNYRGLLFIESQMKKAAKKLDGITGAVDSFSKRGGDGVQRIPVTGGIQAVLGIKGDFRERRDHWEKIQEKVDELASNPELMLKTATDLSFALSGNGAPKIGERYNQKLMKSLNYIIEAVPKPPRKPSPFAPKTQWRPNDYELKLFDDKLEVLANPFSVIEHLKGRTLSKGHVESLQQNYPRMYEEIKIRTSSAMLEKGTAVERGDRIKLSLLFDTDFDSGLSDAGILASQAVYQQQQQPQTSGQKMDVKVAGQYATPDMARIQREQQPS